MNSIEKLKAAQAAASAIIASFAATLADQPNVVEARRTELEAMKKPELIALVLELEAPKPEKTVKVEDVARKILEDPACAVLTYEQIAGLMVGTFKDRNTSGKSIASYVSKNKDTWQVVAREKVKIDINSLMNMAADQPAADQPAAAVNG